MCLEDVWRKFREMMNMEPWVKSYREWLRKHYEDEDEIEETVEAVRVVSEMEKLMPGLQRVLNELSKDDMVMVDGFWRVCDYWLGWRSYG